MQQSVSSAIAGDGGTSAMASSGNSVFYYCNDISSVIEEHFEKSLSAAASVASGTSGGSSADSDGGDSPYHLAKGMPPLFAYVSLCFPSA